MRDKATKIDMEIPVNRRNKDKTSNMAYSAHQPEILKFKAGNRIK